MPLSRRSPESVTAGQAAWEETVTAESSRFLSADDFEGTGILAGVDPCESRYWWIPELLAPEDDGRGNGASDLQAARLASPRPPAAA